MNDRTNRFFERGGTWVMIQFLLMTTVLLLGVAFRGDWKALPLFLAGVFLFLAGAYFGIAGVVALGQNRTPYPRPRDGSVLVHTGIYSKVRHPLYTSVMLISFGWALMWQSRLSLLAALALVPFFLAKSRREERWLNDKFPAYAEYGKRVPRFLPFFTPVSKNSL